jgi:hypothetical protein
MFGLSFIKKLKPCKWRYVTPIDDEREHFGFVAQDVNEIMPESTYAFTEERNGIYYVNYHEFVGPIVKAIQELSAKLDELEKKAGGETCP